MSLAVIVLAICLVPVTGLVGGLVELVGRDARRRSIADAFEARAADLSR